LLRELRAGLFNDLLRRQRSGLGAGVTPNGLRRLAESPQECAAHSLTIGKASFPSNDFGRVMTFSPSTSARLQDEVVRRLLPATTRLGSEGAAELAWSKTGDLSENNLGVPSELPMRCRALAIEHTGFGDEERAGANRTDSSAR
jgi:hypothetical protein